jgi:endonuclease I
MTGKGIKYTFLFLAAFFWHLSLFSQPPGYYSTADGKTGAVLQQALHDIIHIHTELTYNQLWTAFQTTDKQSDGKVWDMYSDIPGGTPAYTFQFISDQCGNYAIEGDCYNREHSFPKSWFNDLTPMYTDLFHIYPTDGKVNGMRGNYAFGVTNSPTWISTNGSKVGNCSYPGYTGVVFEPVGSYKGDFARSYLYMATRYYKEDTGWPGSDMVTGSQPKDWAIKMLMEWHKNDPVSQKEKDRNEAVYLLQGNRNPFIDDPLFADRIWGALNGNEDINQVLTDLKIFPNPAYDFITVEVPEYDGSHQKVTITDISGRIIFSGNYDEHPIKVGISGFERGIYILTVELPGRILRGRFIVSGN